MYMWGTIWASPTCRQRLTLLLLPLLFFLYSAEGTTERIRTGEHGTLDFIQLLPTCERRSVPSISIVSFC